jgi:hypothetical protein
MVENYGGKNEDNSLRLSINNTTLEALTRE